MFALGVTMYGQMTAGSYCYIGPQGIVHGTTVSHVILRITNPSQSIHKHLSMLQVKIKFICL